jgi:hypothetical protein
VLVEDTNTEGGWKGPIVAVFDVVAHRNHRTSHGPLSVQRPVPLEQRQALYEQMKKSGGPATFVCNGIFFMTRQTVADVFCLQQRELCADRVQKDLPLNVCEKKSSAALALKVCTIGYAKSKPATIHC